MADIDMDEMNRVDDREAEEAGTAEEETSFIDDDDGRRHESILIPIGFNPDVDGSRPSGSTPNIRRDVGDVKIIISKNGKMIYSTDKNKEFVINEYKDLIRKAKIEHSKTPAALVEEQLERQNLDAPQELVDNVMENIIKRMDDELSNQSEAISNSTVITENELRELRGILNDVNKKALLYEAMADMTELKADEIRLRSNERPKGTTKTETSDLTRLERFRKWAKENIAGISAVAISAAGIITTIIMGARSAARKGARATSKFTKAVANQAGKVGPVLASVLNLIAKVLGWGAKGIAFLAKNLWILALALTYFLYNEYKKKK
ncbi:Hypothetical predicted protein [Paramuricea clavata]|uniref:Uncharacterized protein n=1 Tax=Paramuricea clavata TaxID=317549 RepID=A0A7D9LUL7_PARCT|nr:Hypothetical predicted protein [Paramuricea clavata]